MTEDWGRLDSISPHWPSCVLRRNSQGQNLATIGRKAMCEVQIADAHISTSHLVIELEVTTEPSEEPTAWLHDKSLNGTYHNGQNIGKGNKVLARSGDVISFIVAPIQRPDGSYHVADPNLKWAAYRLMLLQALPQQAPVLAAEAGKEKVEIAVGPQPPAFLAPSASRGPQQQCTPPEAAHVPLTNGKKEKHNSGLRATSTTTAEIEDDEAGQVKISAHQVGVKRGPSVSDIGLCSPAVARTPEARAKPDWGQPVCSEDEVVRRGMLPRIRVADDIGAQAFKDKYELGETIGSGGYAVVNKGVHRQTGTPVAVKVIDYGKWKMNGQGVSKAQLDQEFEIQQSLSHANIVRMLTVFKGFHHIYVVLEMVAGGDLFDYLIQKAPHGLPEHVAQRFFMQICDGVAYCHSKNVVHRDLKPENILLTHKSDDAQIKIADFGLAKALTGHNDVCKTSCGTPQYMAPEVTILSKKQGSYGKEADLWGLGVILHVMLTCTMPFSEVNEELSQSLEHSQNPHLHTNRQDELMQSEDWNSVSAEAKALIRGLLTEDVIRRFTIADALKDPWLVHNPDRLPIPSPKKLRK